MQPSPANAPDSRSFAGLLAELASPEKKFPPVADLDGLADDIATLTYEHALRFQGRSRPAAAPVPHMPGSAPRESFPAPGPVRHDSFSQATEARSIPALSKVLEAARHVEGLKSASVTVRLTAAENEQLRHRAAEAGLTVSAYLRSCAFEVDTLRSQVKHMLAELRQKSDRPARQSLWSWIWPSKRAAAS
jgi:hypothetical protein